MSKPVWEELTPVENPYPQQITTSETTKPFSDVVEYKGETLQVNEGGALYTPPFGESEYFPFPEQVAPPPPAAPVNPGITPEGPAAIPPGDSVSSYRPADLTQSGNTKSSGGFIGMIFGNDKQPAGKDQGLADFKPVLMSILAAIGIGMFLILIISLLRGKK